MDVLAISGYLVGGIGFLVYLLGTIKKGKNDILRQDNTDLRSSNQELRTENENKKQIIESQKDMINSLKDVATQTPAVNNLIALISKQQAAQSHQHTEIIDKLTILSTELSGLAKAINKSHTGR